MSITIPGVVVLECDGVGRAGVACDSAESVKIKVTGVIDVSLRLRRIRREQAPELALLKQGEMTMPVKDPDCLVARLYRVCAARRIADWLRSSASAPLSDGRAGLWVTSGLIAWTARVSFAPGER